MSGVIKNFCQTCGVRPPAMREIPCCFECWPGGPVTPPPCRRCGSKENYYTSGLCARCHHHAPGPKSPRWESPGKLRRRPIKVASCPDCLAWGVTARYGWMCVACKSWREKYGIRRPVRHLRPERPGQPGRVVPAVPQAPQPGRPAARPPDRDRHPGRSQRARPAAVHRRDLAPGRHDPPRVREEDRPGGHVAAAPGARTGSSSCSTCPVTCGWDCGTSSRRHRTRHWRPRSPSSSATTPPRTAGPRAIPPPSSAAIRIMLGIQDTPGAPIRRSDVMLLTQHQALGRHGHRGDRRRRDARRRHRTAGGPLVQRQDRRPARADAPRTGRVAGGDAQRQHHPAPVQAPLR